jgi:hypothetical protein
MKNYVGKNAGIEITEEEMAEPDSEWNHAALVDLKTCRIYCSNFQWMRKNKNQKRGFLDLQHIFEWMRIDEYYKISLKAEVEDLPCPERPCPKHLPALPSPELAAEVATHTHMPADAVSITSPPPPPPPSPLSKVGAVAADGSCLCILRPAPPIFKRRAGRAASCGASEYTAVRSKVFMHTACGIQWAGTLTDTLHNKWCDQNHISDQ